MTAGGETVSPLNIPAWRDFPLRRRLAEATGLPTWVDNDAKALALGEGWVGAAAGVSDFIAMVVSTGVGGGIVLDGRLLDGADGNAGHIGHVIVEPDGHLCACGARGCLEAEASGSGPAPVHRPAGRRGRARPGPRGRDRRRPGRGLGVPTCSTSGWPWWPGRWPSASASPSSGPPRPSSTPGPGSTSPGGARIIPAGLGDRRPARGRRRRGVAVASAAPVLASGDASGTPVISASWSRATRPKPRPTGRRSRPSWPSTCRPTGADWARSTARSSASSSWTGARPSTRTACSACRGPRSTAGAGLTALEQVVVAEEFAKAGVPSGGVHDVFGIPMVGNTIIRMGTEEQKRHFLPRILSGEDLWCQGYSEPERRLRPRQPRLPGRARRRRVGPERAEDLDVDRPPGQLDLRPHPHRPRRPQAQGDHLPARAHGAARHRGPAHQDDLGRVRVQRGLLHRRPDPEGERGGRGQRRLGGGHDPARLRAGRGGGRAAHQVPHRARPAAGHGPGAGQGRRPGHPPAPGLVPHARSRSCATSACGR